MSEGYRVPRTEGTHVRSKVSRGRPTALELALEGLVGQGGDQVKRKVFFLVFVTTGCCHLIPL